MKRILVKKKLEQDLWIIAMVMMLSFVLLIFIQDSLYKFINTDANILLRTFSIAVFQFGVAGLGAVIVMAYRKESFTYYEFRSKNSLVTIILSIICFIPYILYIVLSGQFIGYEPLSVMITPMVLDSGFPTSFIGMLIIGVVWGFFEGFNYIVISQKINELYPAKSFLLNWGAIVCTFMCVLVHGIIGVNPEQIIELICVVCIIYGMLIIRDKYNNSWGVIAIFVMLWNAF